MMAAAEYFVRVVVGRAIRFEGQMWDLDSDTVLLSTERDHSRAALILLVG